MALIEIFDGSFPAQSAMLLKKSAFVKVATLALRDADKKKIFYNARNAIQSVEIVTPDDKKPGIKLTLKDGKTIIAKTDHKMIEDIRLIIAAGPDETGDMFIEQNAKKPENEKSNTFAAKTGRFFAWIIAIIFGLITLIAFSSDYIGAAVFFAILAASITPPIFGKISASVKENRHAKAVVVGLIVFILIAIGAMFINDKLSTQENLRIAHEQEIEMEARREAYLQSKDTILKDVRRALEKEDYQAAYDAAKSYTGLGDVELEKMYETAGQKVQEKANAEAQERRKAERASKIMDEVKSYEMFLDKAETDFKTTKPSDADLDTIRKALTTFSALAEALNKARQNKETLSASDIIYLKKVEKRLSGSQQRLLPGLRLGFRKRAGSILWEHDTYVSVSGDGNRIINFSAGMFAANANIKATHEQLAEILTKLRFREVRYRWYKEADEFTYYKMDTPPDAKLTYFLHGQFQDMEAGY